MFRGAPEGFVVSERMAEEEVAMMMIDVFRDFGSKVLPIKPFLKQVIPLLDDRDKTIRDEAKLLLVEVYRWIGKQTLMPMIQNVKPIQVNPPPRTIVNESSIGSFLDARVRQQL